MTGVYWVARTTRSQPAGVAGGHAHYELFVYTAIHCNPVGGFEPYVPVKWLLWSCRLDDEWNTGATCRRPH